jgi:filamentous hemagglutinin
MRANLPADDDISRVSPWRRITARILLVVFGSGCILPGGAHGAPIADPTGPIAFRPGIGQTSTGVPAVDITRPNAGGTSYNRYQRFDVDQEGVVLNNSSQAGTTLLGGRVAANPNLSGGAGASVIVNEVVAPGAASRLVGSIEVFGAPAAVIVANPNGVTCAGCGTVNSPRFMLSTGTPVWLDALGAPASFAGATGVGFDVIGGQVRVEGQGLEGTVGKVELVGASIQLDGPVRAHYLNPELAGITVLAGAGRVAEKAGQLDNLSPGQPASAPLGSFAIDGTAFGAMSSSQIRIVSTDQGVGVRMAGALLADSLGLVIRSAGDLSVGELVARQSITLDAAGNLNMQGAAASGGDLSVHAGGRASVNAASSVSGAASLSAADTVEILAPLTVGGRASVSADQVRLAAGVTAGETQIDARSLVLGDGGRDVQIRGDLNLAVAGELVTPGAVTVSGNTRLSAGGSVGLGGDVMVGGNLSVDAAADIRAGGHLSAGGLMRLHAGQALDIVGGVSAGALDLVAGRAVFGGDVMVTGDGAIVAGSLVLPARVEAGGSLRIDTTGDLISSGRVVANGDLSLGTGGRLALAESGAGGRADVTARGGALSIGSPFVAGRAVQLAGRDGVSVDIVQSGGDLGITSSSGGVTTGALLAPGAVGVNAALGLTAAGPVAGGGDVRLLAGNALQLASSVSSGADLRLGGSSVRAREVLAAGEVLVEAGQVEADALGAGEALSVNALTGVSVSGGVLANGPLSVVVSDGALALGGALASNAALAVSAKGDIGVRGGLGSGASAVLVSQQGRITVQGGASTAAGLTLDGARQIDVGGDVAARGPIVLRSRTEGMAVAGSVVGAGSLNADAPGDIRFAGETVVGGDLAVATTAGALAFEQNLEVGGAARLATTRGLRFGGDSRFFGTLNLAGAGGPIANHGRLYSSADFIVDTLSDFTSEGRIDSLGVVSVQAARLVFNERGAGGVFANGGIRLVARDSGRLGSLGTFASSGAIALEGPRFETAGEVLSSGGAITFSGNTLVNAGLAAAQAVVVNGRLENESGGQVSAASVEVRGATLNRGEIGGGSVILADGVNNAGTVVGDRLEVGGDLLNAGSLGGGTLSLSGRSLVNTGLLAAEVVAGTAATLDNRGLLHGGTVDLQLGGDLNNSGVIESAGRMAIVADSLGNSGTLQAGTVGSVRTALAVANDGGQLSAVDGLSIVTGTSLSNRAGRILAGGDLGVQVAGDLSGAGLLAANGHLRVQAGGGVEVAEGGAGGDATLSADGGQLRVGSPFVAGGNLLLTGRDGVVTHALAAGGALGVGSTLGSVGTGSLAASGPVSLVAAGDARVLGSVVSDGAVALSAGAALGVDGVLASGAAARLSGSSVWVGGPVQVVGALLADAGSGGLALSGEVRAGAGVVLKGQQVSASGVLTGGSVAVQAGADGFDNSGSLVGNAGVDVVSLGGVAQRGRVASQGNVALVAGRGLSVSGEVEAGGNLRLESAEHLLANGAWWSAGTLEARAGQSLGNSRDVLAGGAMSLVADAGALTLGGRVAANGALNLKAGGALDAGAVSGGLEKGESVSIEAGESVGLAEVQAGGHYLARAGGDYRVSGASLVVGNLDLLAVRDVAQRGAVSIGGNTTVQAGGSLAQGETRILGQGVLISGGGQAYAGSVSAGDTLELRAGAGVDVAGALRTPAALSVEGGTGAVSVAGELGAGGRLQVDTDKAVTVGGETLALAAAQLRSRQDGIHLKGPVTALEALGLDAAGDVRFGAELAAGASLDARSAAGSVVFERGLGVAGAASFSVGQDLVFLGDALFYGPLSATRVGRTLDSRTRLQVGGDLLLDIAGDFVSEGLLQSAGGVRIQARNITTNLARAGGIVANGDIELVVRDLGQLGALGSVSSSGGSVLLSGSRFSNAGDVIAGGAGLVFSGGTLGNAGQIAAETVRVTGALDNQGAVYGEAISVSGYTTNRGAIAGTALSFDGGLGNAGVIAGRTVSASGTVSNNGEISGDRVSLSGGVVANSGLVSASHVVIQAAELGNQGTLSAGSLDALTLGAFTNAGSVLVGGNADIVADGGFVNQLAEVSRCITPAVCNPLPGSPPPPPPDPDKDFRFVQTPGVLAVGGQLTLSGGRVENRGVIQAGGIHMALGLGALVNARSENDVLTDANFGTEAPTTNTGLILAADDIIVSAGSLLNSGGRIAAGGGLDARVSGELSSVAGTRAGLSPALGGRYITLSGAELRTDGLVHATQDLTLLALTGSLTNRGTLLADNSLAVVAGTAVTNADKAALLGTRSISLKGAHGVDNAGLIYGNGEAAERVLIDAGDGTFRNAGTGTVLADASLDIKAAAYANGGTVASRGDARLEAPTFVFRPASSSLLAFGTLRLDVAGVAVDVGETWVSPATNTLWTGVLVNTGRVLLGGNGAGSVENLATGSQTLAGEPDLLNGAYLLLGLPALNGPYVDQHTDVATRAQFVVNGLFQGSLRNVASDAKAAGTYSYSAGSVAQTVRWTNAQGEIEETAALSQARLDATGGSTVITLESPDAGTIIAGNLGITGVNLSLGTGVDPAAAQQALAASRLNRVTAGSLTGLQGTVTAPGGTIGTGGALQPASIQTAGPTAPVAASPLSPGQTVLAGVTPTQAQGSGVVQVSESLVAGSTAGVVTPTDPGLADPGQPASGNGTHAVPQADIDPASPSLAVGGGESSIKTPSVPATPGGSLPADEAARYGLAFPDWGSFSGVAGTLRADNVDLLLSGRFTNRGAFEVTNQLLIQAEGGIDNFGASIKAGGALGLFGASLDNRNGAIQADSLVLALGGSLDNTRGRILIDKDASFAVGGDLINDSGRIEAGSLALDVGGNLYNRSLYAVDLKDTTTTTHTEYDSVFGTTVTTRSDSTVTQSADLRAGIVARTGDLSLNVGKDLVVTGADLKAAGALTGRVGGNIDIRDLSVETSRQRVDTVSNERSYTLNNGETETTGLTASGSIVNTRIDRQIRHQASVLEAGSKLDLESGGSTVIVGAQVKSGAETRIVAGGHLALGAVVDSTHVEQRLTTRVEGAAILPGLPTANGERLELTRTETAVGGQLDAGGATTLQAAGGLILSGQRINSAGDTRLAGDSVILDGLTLENRQEARNVGATTVSLDAQTRHVGSAIQSAGTLEVTATGKPADAASTAGSIRGSGVQLDASRALTLAAEGDIALEAGRNIEDHATRNRSGTSIVERSRDESARNLLSGEAISLAGRNVTLEAATLTTPGTATIVAREALALTASTDTAFEHTLNVKKSGSWLSKKTTTTEHSEQSLQAATTRIDAQDIQLQSGGDLDLYGARLNAGGEARLSAGGELHAYAVQDVHSVMDRRKVVRAPGIGALLLGEDPTFRRRKTETRDSSTTDEAQVTQLQSVGELTTQSGGDTLLQGTSIAAAQTRIEVGVGDKAQADATLILEGAKSRLDTSHTVSKKSFVWQSQSGQGESTETLTLVNIQGPVTLQAQKIVAQLPEGDFKTQLVKQAAQPGQAWMLQLADRPGVDWKAVALAHDKWDYKQEGLTAEAALMIAIVVSIVMPVGAGAGLASFATGTSVAAGATSAIVLQAGIVALTTQATVTLINNKGNLGKTLSDLGRDETIRNVASAMVTAGALNALAGSISVPNADGTFTPLAQVSGRSDLVAQIGKNVINNTASAVIDTAINGGDLGDKLAQAITTSVIDAAGASAANSVGDLEGFGNRMGHLVVGCALGAAKGGDCGSGAIGGLAGELAAEWYGGNREPVSATQASKTVDVARLFGALAVTLVGGDAQVGATAAGNAAQNNFLNHFQVKQLNERLAQCKGQVGCINQAISEARELDKRQHDLIAQTETAQGSRALVEGIQRPGATIDTSLCAGVSACVKYAEELPLINIRDYNYGVQDRVGELAQIKRIRAFETQIRQADPALSDEEVTRRAAARAGVYDAGRLGQLLGAAGRGGEKSVIDGGLADSSAIRRAYLNNKFERSGDLNLDINFRGNQEVATNFFRSQSVPEGEVGSYMTGIDLYQAVSVQTFGPRKALWQYQTSGAPQGNWYSLSPLVQPTELGISPFGFNRATQTVEQKILGEYLTTERVSMLRSTSASVSDFWSVKGQLYPTVGGAQQLFTTHKSSIILKKEQ